MNRARDPAGHAPWPLLLVLAALLAGVPGLASLPPDEHEVLVLQTAREMHARGEWVVPWFNGEPRLNKPPLSYWLTAGVAAAAGTPGDIRAWHGRLPSLLAGLVTAGLLVAAGRRLHGARAAAVAAGLFVTSAGYFTYTHDARPDMLYAGLCWAALAAFATGLAGAGRAPPRALVLAGWALLGLATLAKGPQVPAMILVALALYVCVVERGGPRALARLRPLGGLCLFAGIALPWWWLLDARLPADAVAGSQLGGSLLRPDWGRILNGYYLYRPLQLVLPWVPLVPLAWLALPLRGATPAAASVRLWLTVLAICVVAFGFGSQQRYFYLLPLLPVLCLLGGIGAARWLDRAGALPRAGLWLQVGLAGAAVLWLFADHGRLQPGLVLAALAAVTVALAGRLGRDRLLTAGAATMLAVALSFGLFAESGRFWSADRRAKAALAQTLAATAAPDTRLAALHATPAVYVWAVNRPIPRLASTAALGAWLEGGPGWVLMPVATAAGLPPGLSATPVAVMPAQAPDRAGWYAVAEAESAP